MNAYGRKPLENCPCYCVKNKTNKDTEYDLKKLFNAQLIYVNTWKKGDRGRNEGGNKGRSS